ncbi:helix-turn-helix domain-containing protein [Erythrobacter aureus]|uniref:XRE family transcriptional regulator n=1 Tax=Erythrobacter aureus TaxID=2182384 RepID=A0A345YGD1_9SPHN|nr:helix-turn-helix transcriptional regulator [Erythrobacter aureus]AXK42983.1 XRE family transcriptional regulator [Erythrobacter aureus]
MTTRLEEYPNRIREFRKLRGMTQKELGNALGMTAVNIGHLELERRDPSLSNLRALARVLGVSVGDLLAARDTHKIMK